jgi:DNA polymerase III epsilon subunit-like protein
MTYLSLDLELNNTEEGLNNPKIIQIGVCIGKEISDIKKYKWYVYPEEPITEYITKLTGITNNDVVNRSKSVSTIAQEISDLISEHKTYSHPIVWGCGDVGALMKLFLDNDVIFEHFGYRELDVKQIYSYLTLKEGKKPYGSLSSSMKKMGYDFKGDKHRADIDAYNTLVFWFKLLERA